MNVFQAYLITQFKITNKYKSSIFTGLTTQIFFTFFKIFTISAFLISNSSASPLDFKSTVSYIWLTQIFFAIIPWNVNWDDLNSIASGKIAYELARPLDLFQLMFTKTLAWRLTTSIVRIIPMIFFSLIILPILNLDKYALHIPSGINFTLFIISIIIAYFLSAMITTLIYSISIYTISATNFIGIFNSIAFVLSGLVIPLSFFPNYLQKIFDLQPFKGIIDTPALIYSGVYGMTQSIYYIILQLIWFLIFYLCTNFMFRNGYRKINIHGG